MTQRINTTEARELFQKTTQGKWELDKNHFALVSEHCEVVVSAASADTNDDEAERDILFCQFAHTHWLVMLDEIERLRANIKEIASLGAVDGGRLYCGRWVRESEIADILERVV